MLLEFTAYHNIIVHSLKRSLGEIRPKTRYSSRVRSALNLIYIHQRRVVVRLYIYVYTHAKRCVRV